MQTQQWASEQLQHQIFLIIFQELFNNILRTGPLLVCQNKYLLIIGQDHINMNMKTTICIYTYIHQHKNYTALFKKLDMIEYKKNEQTEHYLLCNVFCIVRLLLVIGLQDKKIME